MELIVKELTKLKDIIFGNGISDDKIIEAEQKLGVFFSKEYRAYLSEFGIVAVNGHELTGLGSSSRVDVVNVTQSIIQNYGALVDSAYVIENDNIDSVVYWQKSSGEIFRTVGNSKPLYVADSLLEYVNL